MSTEEKKRYSFGTAYEFEYEHQIANETPQVIEYRINVLSGVNRDKYIKDVKKNLIKGVDGKPDMKDPEGMTALILTYACERKYGEGDWRKVPTAEIQSWPSPMQEELNEIALKMSGMGPKAKEEVKND